MSAFTVHGVRSIFVMLTVEADSAKEAVEKALRGEYTHIDTEPGRDIKPKMWTAERVAHD